MAEDDDIEDIWSGGGAEEDEIDQCPLRLTITLRTWTKKMADNAWENISDFLGNSPAEVMVEGHSITEVEKELRKYYILGPDDLIKSGDEVCIGHPSWAWNTVASDVVGCMVKYYELRPIRREVE